MWREELMSCDQGRQDRAWRARQQAVCRLMNIISVLTVVGIVLLDPGLKYSKCTLVQNCVYFIAIYNYCNREYHCTLIKICVAGSPQQVNTAIVGRLTVIYRYS